MYFSAPSTSSKCSWVEGTYRVLYDDQMFYSVKIIGNLARLSDFMGEFTLVAREGVFVDPDQRGLAVTGKDDYNVELLLYGQRKMCAVVGEGGKTWTLMNGSTWEWMEEEFVNRLEEKTQAINKFPNLSKNSKIFCNAFGRMSVQIPSQFVLNPSKPGKLVWVSGCSAMGKTSISTYLKEEHGFIHYEGDCFLFGLNPYISKETIRCGDQGVDRHGWVTLADEMMFSEQVYTALCHNILMEQEKIGGDWVISQGIYCRERRDQVKKMMGSRLKLVVLEMDLGLQTKRFQQREVGSEDMTEEVFERKKKERSENIEGYEPAEDDEDNIVRIHITESMTVQDIGDAIIGRL